MADNVVLDAGAGGDTIAADDVAGVKYQIVKLAVGAADAAALVGDAAPIPVSDAGGVLTVDGTVTANLGATDNAVLDAIAASVAGTLTVGSHAVTNTGTFAVQATGTVDLGATDNAVLDAIAASVAGTLTVGSHAVTNAGTFATQAVCAGVAAEDAAASGNPVLVGGRYDSVARTLETGDVGAVALNASGQVLVEIAAGAGSGGTAAADDADFTAGTTSGTPAMGVYESTPTSVTDGDLGTVGITVNRALKVAVTSGGISGVLEDAAAAGGEEGVLVLGVRRDTAASSSGTDGDFSTFNFDSTGRMWCNVSNTVTVGSHAVTNAGTFAVQAALNAGTNNIGDVDVLTVPADPFGANADAASATGSISAKLRFIAATGIPITGTVTVGSHAVTNAGTFAVQAASAGIAADDAATSGNPVLVAGVAVETDGTDPTTVSAEGDAAYLRTDRARRLLVSDHHPRSFFTSADYGAAQTNASVQAAPGAGLSLYINDIVISNGATAGNITLLDGSGGTVKFEIYPAINGGVSISLKQPIRLTANTALCITSTTVTTHSVNIGGYTAP